jgi:hypothetical protein
MKHTNRSQRRRAAYALLVAGPLIIVGHALSVDMGDSGGRYVHDLIASRTMHVLGGMITATAALLLSIGLFAARSSLPGRVTRIAATIAAVGAAGMAMGLAMVAMIMGALAGKNPDLAVRAYDVLNHATLASLPFLIAYLFTIGIGVLAAALTAIGGSYRPVGLLLLVGTMIDFVTPSGGLFTAALHIPQGLAFALLGLALLRPGPQRAEPIADTTRVTINATTGAEPERVLTK